VTYSVQFDRESQSGNNCLNILSLNVCGLVSKQNNPDFIDFISNYDIIGIQETKMDDLDHIQIKGYKCFDKNRKTVTKRKSGGVSILVKENLIPFVKLVETESKLVQWFVLSKQLTHKDDILFGVFYIPPESSSYAIREPYFEIQQELNSFSNKYDCICLFGDNNSRTKNLKDFIEADQYIFDLQNMNEITEEFMQEHVYFEKSNVSEQRNNSDKSSNNQGVKFIEFLQENGLFILNGRTVGDLIGNATSNGVSTVDYFISSPNLFPLIESMCVHDFCPLLSDVHNPISLKFDINPLYKCTCKDEPESMPTLWDKTETETFIQNVKEEEINMIYTNLCQLQDLVNIEQSEIDQAVADLGKIYIQAAENSFKPKIKRKENTCGIHKDLNNKLPSWYGQNCKTQRKIFHKAKSKYKASKTSDNKNNLKKQSKRFKATMKKYFSKFKRENISKLKNLKTSDPRKYWQILNRKNRNEVKASLEDLYAHFKNVNFDENVENTGENIDVEENSINELNSEITIEEVEQCVKNLKNNKASGIDKILNEHIKTTFSKMKHIFVKLFNIVLNTGLIPETWTTGMINPIFKDKGDPKCAENYRPITLLSCLGKLFTAVLNIRLQKYADTNNIINDYQAGFRSGYSTTDNIFILHSLIQLQRNSKRKLYCAFIDLKQAFDTVWRAGLWQKLLSYNINGKFFKVIKSMYNGIKSCVTVNGTCSNFFNSNIGVRQGENLSPILFSLYLNDLHSFLQSSDEVNGVNIENTDFNSNINTYLKLYILLYADDTVIVSHSADDLQRALNAYETYCNTWKLTVNSSKSKIVIFSSGRQEQTHFTFNNNPIETMKEYKYLGIFFSRSGSFFQAKKHIASQATRALYSLLRKLRPLMLPIDMQIDIFNKTIKPILLYGSEIWGFGNIEIIERVQLKFLKHILHVKNSTPNNIIYGETGVFPVSVDIKTRAVAYWSNIVYKKNNILALYTYNHIRAIYDESVDVRRDVKFGWISNIKTILTNCGFIDIWRSQTFPNCKWLKLSTNQKLKDLFINEWFGNIEQSSGCFTYKLFKKEFEFEKYLVSTPPKFLIPMIRFRTRNHRLPIETGRWANIPRENRLCPLCQRDIGDEFHYILSCSYFSNTRKKLLKVKYYQRPNVITFGKLMNCKNSKEYINLCKLVKNITDIFKSLPR